MLSLSAAAIRTSCCCVFLTLVCVTEANPPFWLWQKPNFSQFWNIEDQGNYACGHLLSYNILFLLVHLYIIFLLPLFLLLSFHTLFTSVFLFPCHRRQQHRYPFSSFSLFLFFFFFSSTHCESCRVFFCYTLESGTSEAKCDTDSTAAQEMLQRSFAPCSPLLSWCIRGMTGPKQDVGRLNVYDKSAWGS